MSEFDETNEENKARWEANAGYWDQRMGDHSNHFHCNVVRPHTEELLQIQEGDLVLDIACGNGNFSGRLAEAGADVIAFDFSKTQIENAKRRRSSFKEKIKFRVCDATNYEQLMTLKQSRPFDKAVANMAVMDISSIRSLFQAVADMLKPGGIFVFSTHHPCYQGPRNVYMTPCIHEGESIIGQPVLQYYYHRSLQDILHQCFNAGFYLSGFYEEIDDDPEIPVIIIVRLTKISTKP